MDDSGQHNEQPHLPMTNSVAEHSAHFDKSVLVIVQESWRQRFPTESQRQEWLRNQITIEIKTDLFNSLIRLAEAGDITVDQSLIDEDKAGHMWEGHQMALDMLYSAKIRKKPTTA